MQWHISIIMIETKQPDIPYKPTRLMQFISEKEAVTIWEPTRPNAIHQRERVCKTTRSSRLKESIYRTPPNSFDCWNVALAQCRPRSFESCTAARNAFHEIWNLRPLTTSWEGIMLIPQIPEMEMEMGSDWI